MTIIAEDFEFVVGVDTHARTHMFTTIHSATGAVVDTTAFPSTGPGMDRAHSWIRRRRHETDAIMLPGYRVLSAVGCGNATSRG